VRTLLLLALVAGGCTGPELEHDLKAFVTRPGVHTLTAGPAETDLGLAYLAHPPDWSYVRLYIASDRGGDSLTGRARRRLAVVARTGGTTHFMGEGGDVNYRDDDAGVDCSSFTGTFTWGAEDLTVFGYCADRPDVNLWAVLSGAYVRSAIAKRVLVDTVKVE
jgi:hypothetical protein